MVSELLMVGWLGNVFNALFYSGLSQLHRHSYNSVICFAMRMRLGALNVSLPCLFSNCMIR